MTNNWTDIGNASMVFVMGANPAENHPACMAHINKARSKGASLVVVDPRKTRTATQADRYIRIRPGTDIAFINSVLKTIIADMEARDSADPVRVAFYAFLNQSEDVAGVGGRPFYADGFTTATTIMNRPIYTDARFLIKTDGSDYQRYVTATDPFTVGSQTVDQFPKMAASVEASADTVYSRLKAHVAPYDTATAANICGCTAADIEFVATQFIANSRCSAYGIAHSHSVTLTGTGAAKLQANAIQAGSVSITGYSEDTGLGGDYKVDYSTGQIARTSASTIPTGTSVTVDYTGVTSDPRKAGYKATTILYAMGITQHTCGAQSIKDFAVLQTLMGNMGRAGGGINALRGIHNVQGSTDMGLLYGNIPAYSGNPTQMTTGGLYSPPTGTPTTNDPNAFGRYMNALWGNPMSAGTANGKIDSVPALSDVTFVAKAAGVAGNSIIVDFVAAAALAVNVSGSTITVDVIAGTTTAAQVATAVNAHATAKTMVVATAEGAGTGFVDAPKTLTLAGGGTNYEDAYVTARMALQQRGFYNMTLNWFSNPSWTHTRNDIDGIYDLWPKTNGDDHVTMFRKMGLGTITAAVVWGQNPAVTEPNQGKVRAGLKKLNLLVCVDMFENETAACERDAGTVTYLIPAASHVEEAGSVTNSGRVLQWRERTRLPAGNTKADLELFFRFAFALDAANAFSHIEAAWTAQSRTFTSAYDTLYGAKYGWSRDDATAFEDVTFHDSYTQNWTGTATAPSATTALLPLKGTEAMCEKIFREMAAPSASGGTIWIYTGAFNNGSAWATDNKSGSAANWQVYNRAKSRDNAETTSTLTFGAWGYSWLVNRRVLYNNAEVPGDVADFYMGPDSVSRLFVSTNTAVLNYSRWYRTIHRLADKPDVALAGATAAHVLAGRFPGHTEPYETLRTDLIGTWGRNTKNTAKWDLVKSDTAVYAPDDVAGSRTATKPAAIVAAAVAKPAIADGLVLTSIRCVEHFQGGPITRNNSWNVEAEPEPWIEINSVDAAARGILTGDWVNVYTVRGDSITSQEAITSGAAFAQGFRARVGVGLLSNQRTGVGVVAIPWHWGDKGLSTGSRANDLCIDACDANTVIPEYKACVCWIKKA